MSDEQQEAAPQAPEHTGWSDDHAHPIGASPVRPVRPGRWHRHVRFPFFHEAFIEYTSNADEVRGGEVHSGAS